MIRNSPHMAMPMIALKTKLPPPSIVRTRDWPAAFPDRRARLYSPEKASSPSWKPGYRWTKLAIKLWRFPVREQPHPCGGLRHRQWRRHPGWAVFLETSLLNSLPEPVSLEETDTHPQGFYEIQGTPAGNYYV
ncbi:MAG: hypothetical protein M2R45_03845 [Verrucomicrobia subdivision 3 bacterium]|nr:hypothetical protein [Limisphaerales bacterium]MCS1415801.1 hypothetical protein [Limisphaerales bacterium]